MKNIALIDFCGTLVDFQTLNPYLELVLKNRSKIKYYLFCNKFVKSACKIISKVFRRYLRIKFLYKAGLVWLLKGVREEEFIRQGHEYYNKTIRHHLISESIESLRSFKDKGYELLIVSGGSKYYISHFANEFGIDGFLTAEIEFGCGACTGRIIRECMLSEKVKLINDYVHEKGCDCVFRVGMTDSISDLPMLELCDRKLIVSCRKHQKWVTGDLYEIIY